jgi:hypothetical protein
MKPGTRVAALLFGTVVAVGGGAGLAQALPGGPWASASEPQAVNFAGWRPVGYSYGNWQGYREDQGRGSRIQDWSASRAVSGYNGGDRGAFTQHTWYSNGNYCYVNSFSNAGGGVACQTGWHKKGSNNSGSNASSSWKYWETWGGVDPTGNSGRGQMKTCWNVVSAPDSCAGGSYLRGAKYDD